MTLNTYYWPNKPLDLNTGAFWKKNGYKVRAEAETCAYLETRWGTSLLFAYRDTEPVATPEAAEKRRAFWDTYIRSSVDIAAQLWFDAHPDASDEAIELYGAVDLYERLSFLDFDGAPIEITQKDRAYWYEYFCDVVRKLRAEDVAVEDYDLALAQREAGEGVTLCRPGGEPEGLEDGYTWAARGYRVFDRERCTHARLDWNGKVEALFAITGCIPMHSEEGAKRRRLWRASYGGRLVPYAGELPAVEKPFGVFGDDELGDIPF